MSKKKKINKLKMYLNVISVIVGWLSLTTLIMVLKYDILPFKYLFPLAMFLILVPTLLIVFMLKKKIKPKIKIVLSIISIILIFILCILLFYLNRTFSFLDNLGNNDYKIENYLVMVLNDSEYTNIENLKDKSLGYVKNDISQVDKALFKLDEVINTAKVLEENYDFLVNKLYNKKLDSIMVEESYYSILEENISDFSTKTKVIYKIEVQVEELEVVKHVDVKSDTFNIYISGIDTYGSISAVSRSDVNIIATINPTTHQILLTTIPRDYYVQLDGTTGYKDKLTHAGIYGINKSIKTIENLLDIEINYYVKVNFSSVEKIVDTLGGVDVYSEYTFTGHEGAGFTRGYNRVNGKQALEFARTRYTVEGGDRTRGKNQQALISALINKACSKEIITKYTSLLSTLDGSFTTNMSTDKITDFIKKQIDDMKPWNVASISLDGSDGYQYTYSYSHQQLYVMIPDENTIISAKDKIKQIKNNEILDGSYIENNGYVNTPTTKVETPQMEEPKPEEAKDEIDLEPNDEIEEIKPNVDNEKDEDDSDQNNEIDESKPIIDDKEDDNNSESVDYPKEEPIIPSETENDLTDIKNENE